MEAISLATLPFPFWSKDIDAWRALVIMHLTWRICVTSKGCMVAITKWSHAAEANGFRAQFFSHCFHNRISQLQTTCEQDIHTLARWTNLPNSPTISSKGQNCTRGGPEMTTFFFVAWRVNFTLVYFSLNSMGWDRSDDAGVSTSEACGSVSSQVWYSDEVSGESDPPVTLPVLLLTTIGRILVVFMQIACSS